MLDVPFCRNERIGQSGIFKITYSGKIAFSIGGFPFQVKGASFPVYLFRFLGLSDAADAARFPRSSRRRLLRLTSAGVRQCDSRHRSKSRIRIVCRTSGCFTTTEIVVWPRHLIDALIVRNARKP